MVSVYDVPADLLIKRLAEELKDIPEIKQPEWTYYVKTSPARERRPENTEWWYVRAASILRKVYVKGPIGISRLRSMYGGRRNRGVKPEHFYKGSGKVVRVILQQLEAAGLVEKRKINGRALGRGVTSRGMALMDSVAYKLKKELQKAMAELKKYT